MPRTTEEEESEGSVGWRSETQNYWPTCCFRSFLVKSWTKQAKTAEIFQRSKCRQQEMTHMCGPVNLHHHVQSFLRGGNFVELRRNQEEKPTDRPSDWLADWPAGPLSSSAHWCLRHDRPCHLVLGRRGLIGSSRSRDERLSAAVNLTYPPLLSASPVSTSRPWQLALLSASSEGNSGLKASCPSPSFLLSPEEVGGMAGISQHPRGAPTSWLFPPQSVAEIQSWLLPFSVLPLACWFPSTGASPHLKPPLPPRRHPTDR